MVYQFKFKIKKESENSQSSFDELLKEGLKPYWKNDFLHVNVENDFPKYLKTKQYQQNENFNK